MAYRDAVGCNYVYVCLHEDPFTRAEISAHACTAQRISLRERVQDIFSTLILVVFLTAIELLTRY